MTSKLNDSIKNQLLSQDEVIHNKLDKLERELQEQGLNAQKEIDLYLKKQENIAKTIEYLDQLQSIEQETDLKVEKLKKAQKASERKYKMARKSRLESWIMDYKMGAARTKGTSTHDSYLDNIHYYQNQLDSLVSSLES